MPLSTRIWSSLSDLSIIAITRDASHGFPCSHSFTRFDLICVAQRHYLDMALVDFYQLVDLYKPLPTDGCFLPIHCRPLPMSTTPPRSPLPSAESAQPQFATPRRDPSVLCDAPGSTPNSRGSSVRKNQEGDTDRIEGYKREDYEDYIREDLSSRVFVDFEVFMKSVLHVPADWKTQWGPVIEAVKADQEFREHHEGYCRQCDKSGSPEKSFYDPLRNTANAVLRVLSRSSSDDDPGNPQYYHVNDPKKLQGGVINRVNLSPDLVVLHDDCQPSRAEGLHWANALHVLEVKPYDGAICDGANIPGLVTDGEPAANSFRG